MEHSQSDSCLSDSEKGLMFQFPPSPVPSPSQFPTPGPSNPPSSQPPTQSFARSLMRVDSTSPGVPLGASQQLARSLALLSRQYTATRSTPSSVPASRVDPQLDMKMSELEAKIGRLEQIKTHVSRANAHRSAVASSSAPPIAPIILPSHSPTHAPYPRFPGSHPAPGAASHMNVPYVDVSRLPLQRKREKLTRKKRVRVFVEDTGEGEETAADENAKNSGGEDEIDKMKQTLLLQCRGMNRKKRTRCRNPALMEYIGPRPLYCAEHISMDADCLYHKCPSSYQKIPEDGKRCKEVVLKEFGRCYKHIHDWLRDELMSPLPDAMERSQNLLERTNQLVIQLEQEALDAKNEKGELYQRKTKLLPKYQSIAQSLEHHIAFLGQCMEAPLQPNQTYFPMVPQ